MKKILLQIGHQNIEKLTGEGLRKWRDYTALRKSTGASGERVYFGKLVPILAERLKKAGFEVTVTDAIYNGGVYNVIYDLYISFHYDGGNDQNRCMISSPLRGQEYLTAKAHDEADRFCTVFKETYPQLTGTVNNDAMITAGMREYYGFDFVDENTPAVIIEHFNHTSPQGAILKNDIEKVVNADYLTILKFFNMADTNNSFYTFDTTRKMPEKAFNQLGWHKLPTLAKDYALNSYALDTVGEVYEKQAEKIKKLNDSITDLKTENTKKITDLETEHTIELGKLQAKINELIKQNAKAMTIGEVIMQVWYKIKDITIDIKK